MRAQERNARVVAITLQIRRLQAEKLALLHEAKERSEGRRAKS
jgi:hypothetical protein